MFPQLLLWYFCYYLSHAKKNKKYTKGTKEKNINTQLENQLKTNEIIILSNTLIWLELDTELWYFYSRDRIAFWYHRITISLSFGTKCWWASKHSAWWIQQRCLMCMLCFERYTPDSRWKNVYIITSVGPQVFSAHHLSSQTLQNFSKSPPQFIIYKKKKMFCQLCLIAKGYLLSLTLLY